MKWLIFVFSCFLLFGCGDTDLTLVEIESGKLKGTVEGDIYTWKGVPYAKPPIEDLRWKGPQDLEPWEGIKMANQYGNICPQTGYGEQSIYEIPAEKMSEDCLYLNVWSPNPKPEKLLPVFVWIHGGSLTREGGSHPQYLGKNLAKKGVVYVSINYRLNAFGFLAHPLLSKEDKDGVSGNYGLMDQIKALEWIQDNIAMFGGDPDQVTIAGESAGAWSVTILTALPAAKGLFHRAIAQSGAYLWPGPELKNPTHSYLSGEEEGRLFIEKLGANTLKEMRQIPADEIRDLFFSRENTISSEPYVDGYWLPKQIRDFYISGEQNEVDVITGANAEEWSLWIPPSLPIEPKNYKVQLEEQFPGFSDELMKIYKIRDSASIAEAYMHLQGDSYFHLHDRSWARHMSAQGNAVYMYHFSKTPNERYPRKYGAFHGAEIVYALNNLENDPGPIGSGTISQEDQDYADMVSDYWVNFTKSGKPNGENLSEWPKWDPKNEPYLLFDEKEVNVGEHLLKERLDGLEKIWNVKYGFESPD